MPFDKFNDVLEKYNEEFVAAETEEQREAVNKKFDQIITKAETELESALEEQFKLDLELLEKEQLEQLPQEEVEVEIKDEELSIKDDVFLISQEEFVKKYRVKDASALAKELGLKSSGREADIVSRIYEFLKQ